jgi:hypothetical protein
VNLFFTLIEYRDEVDPNRIRNNILSVKRLNAVFDEVSSNKSEVQQIDKFLQDILSELKYRRKLFFQNLSFQWKVIYHTTPSSIHKFCQFNFTMFNRPEDRYYEVLAKGMECSEEVFQVYNEHAQKGMYPELVHHVPLFGAQTKNTDEISQNYPEYPASGLSYPTVKYFLNYRKSFNRPRLYASGPMVFVVEILSETNTTHGLKIASPDKEFRIVWFFNVNNCLFMPYQNGGSNVSFSDIPIDYEDREVFAN